MAYPSLPSIIIPQNADSFRNHGAHHDRYSSSVAMPIPGLETQNDVPPPLPPPRYLPGTEPQLPEDMRDPRDKRDFGRSPASFASGYGSMASSFAEERPSFLQRGPRGFNSDRDEGYSSYSTDRSSRDSYGGPRFSLHHGAFKSPAEIHCDSLKKRLDSARLTDKAPGRSLLSASVNEMPSRRTEQRIPPPALSLPFHPHPMLDSPMHSAVSPRAGPFQYGDHSPIESSDMDHSPQTRTRRNNSDDATSTQGSYDFNAEDMDMEETSSLKRLHIDDAYVGVQKRRQGSPPEEHLLASQFDLARRSRGSPEARLSTITQGAAISSVPPARSMSYMSSISGPPPSLPNASSFGRRSPGLSPGGVSPTSCHNSPYTAPMSLNASPRTSISGRGAAHARTVSSASSRKMEVPKPSLPKLQDLFMCDCCPKKPKRFETAEELQAHAAEKQYNCSFCGNRFKNKNEAERHQNSLHVRRHSWSCSALSRYDRAFHASTHRPGDADTCGYCGEDFYRSGRGPGANAPRHATDKDWDERIRHLQETHKFKECNSSKKFYRADHFRQHLKHSHAGTSGKWTNMLENACMLEEDPTPR